MIHSVDFNSTEELFLTNTFFIDTKSEEPIQPCKYIVGKKPIGEGSYSSIFECKSSLTGCHYAVKRYNKKFMRGMESMLQHEFAVLKSISINNDNILTLIDYFETKNHIYLVTDLADGDLFDRIFASRKLPESEAREIAYSLVSTLAYLHDNSIVHRDIKPENILFQLSSALKILLGDFGLARILQEDELLYEKSGTLSYMAPETVQRTASSFPSDIWAVGVTIYFMLCGYHPFDCELDEETVEAITNADFRFEPHEYWGHISQDAKNFIRCCFTSKPQMRPSAKQLLSHAFINDLGIRDRLINLTLSSTESVIIRSRKNSTVEGATMLGIYCDKPELVSEFNTPILSRNQSCESLVESKINWKYERPIHVSSQTHL